MSEVATIKFAVHRVRDDVKWRQEPIHRGETVRSVAIRLGVPDLERDIARANGIVSVLSPFSGRGRTKLWVPQDTSSVEVRAGEQPPRVTDGFAKLGVLDRPQRTGLSVFTGYNPIVIEIPIQFENFADGAGGDIEDAIAMLEAFAGRGKIPGAGSLPPRVLRITTWRAGEKIRLLPEAYAYEEQGKSPLYQIAKLDWDPSPLRNSDGRRTRQAGVVTVQQYVSTDPVSRVSVKPTAIGKPKKQRSGLSHG